MNIHTDLVITAYDSLKRNKHLECKHIFDMFTESLFIIAKEKNTGNKLTIG